MKDSQIEISVLNTIEEALEDLRQGKIIIVVDDADRENEGDFLMASQYATPEAVNFMATHGRGLICVAITEERCKELNLEMMVLVLLIVKDQYKLLYVLLYEVLHLFLLVMGKYVRGDQVLPVLFRSL